jgi:ferredoxin-NADP reductase
VNVLPNSETSVAAKLIAVIPETPDVQTLRLERPFDYKPGQAAQITFPGDPKKRFYSISSSPTESDRLDLTIKSEQGSPLYASLFQLKNGSLIEVAGPMGKFCLPEPLQGPYYFLAGGSGVTPFRSMIKFILDRKPDLQTWLFHSVRTPDDLIFKDQFLAWEQNPAFHFVPTFTRTTELDIKGETGRIGDVLLKKHLDIHEGTFFLCGPKEFVTDMEHTLVSLTVSTSRIRRENW